MTHNDISHNVSSPVSVMQASGKMMPVFGRDAVLNIVQWDLGNQETT